MTLQTLLDPRAIAVIGASDNPESVGGRIIGQLKSGYTGRIQPVNPKYRTVQSIPSFSSLSEVDVTPDLVLIAARSDTVPDLLDQCAAEGVPNVAVFSSGFAETGTAGLSLQQRMSDTVARTGIRLLGPNCLGFANFRRGFRATFTKVPFEEKDGNIAVIGQSGAMGIGVAGLLRDDGLGLSFWAATGNELDLTAGELALALVESEHDAPDVVALVLEGVNNVEHLLAAGRRATELGKQLVVFKVGSSEAGARAVISHTASVMVESAVFEAACEQSGIILVDDMRKLVDTTKAFAAGRRPKGDRLAIVSGSGGMGVLMSDAAEAVGLALPQPSEELRGRLSDLIPSFGSTGNPIDFTGNVINDQSSLAELLRVVGTSDEFDAVVVSGIPKTLPDSYRQTILDGMHTTDKPYFAYAHQHEVLVNMAERGLTCFSDATAMVHACRKLVQAESGRRLLGEVATATASRLASLSAGPRVVAEREAKQIVSRYGIDIPAEFAVDSAHAAWQAAQQFPGAAVLKINAAWLPHKSDVGGILLGVRGQSAVTQAYGQLVEVARANAPGPDAEFDVLVQEQVPSGLELMVGLVRDPVFGPVVSLSSGGVTAEIVAESALSVVPFGPQRARLMVESLWGGRLVRHHRGLSTAAVDALVEVLLGMQQLAVDEPAIDEVDINPLIVVGDRVVAVDALLTIGGNA
ncbi:acetate--CoA ligase family protein [Rhodococcus opacus]|uniref:acetate--CoA ligase family protein n=1 Tax=Rhodococcus opacus TaxID=37919 RepID=UPI001C446811|nr:acetate--CoA ligase family protein [Rhodococcus opacus]MBV6756258.1 acetate--CoA ligase family protein [Rhodococcus opacus]